MYGAETQRRIEGLMGSWLGSLAQFEYRDFWISVCIYTCGCTSLLPLSVPLPFISISKSLDSEFLVTCLSISTPYLPQDAGSGRLCSP